MAWVAVDKFRGQEFIYEEKPVRDDSQDLIWLPSCCDQHVALPKGSIAKLIGRELTWEDEPVELNLTNLRDENN